MSDAGWDKIWSKKDFLNTLVNAGRNVYNYFFLRLILRHADQNTDLAELGCGTATLSLALSQKIKSYTGIDYSEEAVALAIKNTKDHQAKNIQILQGDALDLPQELLGKFDLVWSQGLAEHFNSLEAIIKAHWLLAKPGAKILISVPYRYSYHSIWYLLTRPSFLRRLWPWEDVNTKFLTQKELLAVGRILSLSAKIIFLSPTLIGWLLGVIILKIKK